MRKLGTKRVLALVAAGVVVATGAGAAIAAASGDSPSPSAFFDAVARHLGITTDKLKDATKAAAIDQVDAALKAGKITQAQADELKSKIESGDFPLFFGGPMFGGGPGNGGPMFGGPGGHMIPPGDRLSAAATYLGLSVDELQQKLEAGQSLADIAKAQGKSVSGLEDAMIADAQKQLDADVAAGRLTADQAKAILDSIKARIDAIVNLKPGDFPAFGKRAFGDRPFGFGFFGGGRPDSGTTGAFSGQPGVDL